MAPVPSVWPNHGWDFLSGKEEGTVTHRKPVCKASPQTTEGGGGGSWGRAGSCPSTAAPLAVQSLARGAGAARAWHEAWVDCKGCRGPRWPLPLRASPLQNRGRARYQWLKAMSQHSRIQIQLCHLALQKCVGHFILPSLGLFAKWKILTL